MYRGTGDWLLGLYNRVLIRPIGRMLPGRMRIRRVRVRSLKDPVFVRLGTTDWLVLEELFLHDGYGSVLRGVSDVRQIVDLGSNIGLSVRLWQKHFPNAQIVAVEPDDGNFALAQLNVQAGEDPQRVRFLKTLAAGSSRPAYLDRTGGEWGYSMASTGAPNEAPIQSLTLPQILKHAGDPPQVDLLKCDIEGAEAELFADCGLWIKRVKSIVVELHAEYTKAKFLADINRAGGDFDVTTISESGWNAVLILHSRARQDSEE